MQTRWPVLWNFTAICAVAVLAALWPTSAAQAGGDPQTAGGSGAGVVSTGSGGESKCAAADTLKGLGRFKGAEKAYEKTLEGSGSADCAKTGLEELDESGECAQGKALLESDEKSEAKKAYVEALAARPESACAKAGVENASDQSLWDELDTVSSDALSAVGLAVLALVGAALAIGVLGLAAIYLLLFFPPTKRWARHRFRRPAVSVETLDDSGLKEKLGAGTTSLLREKIELGSGSNRLKLVSGESTAAETWIAKVSEIGDQGKIAAAFLSLFYLAMPRRHVKVSGALQPAAAPDGHGISLELHHEVDSRGSTTLWASRFLLPLDESAATVRRLAVPSAAWVSHVITRETDGENLAADDPLSWALFKTGIELQRTRKLGEAARLYEEALVIDPNNYGALTNLGLIEAGLGKYVRAIPRLREALVKLEQG